MVELAIVSFVAVTVIGWWCIRQIVGLKISVFILLVWLIYNMIIVNCVANEPTKQELEIDSQNRKGVGYI